MKKIQILIGFFLAAGFVGCAPSKILVMQSPIVSMTKLNSGNAKALKEGAAIEEKWCNSEKPIRKNSDGSLHYGMIDQVIWRAHQKTKADFFMNSRFYQQGECMWMNAVVAR